MVYVDRSHVWCLVRFVAKVRSLDPSYRDVMPWQPRGYSRKRGREGGREGEGQVHEPQAKKLFSPLLAGEKVGPQQVYAIYYPHWSMYTYIWRDRVLLVVCGRERGTNSCVFANTLPIRGTVWLYSHA